MTSAGRRIVLSAAAIFGFAACPLAAAIAQDGARLPGLDNFQLESPRPAPLPTPTPTPRAIPIPDAPRIVFPTPAASPTPRAARPSTRPAEQSPDATTPTPATRRDRAAAATVSDAPVPVATPAPAPVPSAVATPQAATPAPVQVPTPQPTAVAPAPASGEDAARSIWPWLLGGLGVVVVAAVMLRRRRPVSVVKPVVTDAPRAAPSPRDGETPAAPVPAKPAPARTPAPPPVAVASAAPRARLALTLRPLRAGLNMLSAVVDCEVTITNTGTVTAEDIRLDVRLLSAGAGQDADLAAIYTQAPVRPAVPVFMLEPGETRQVKALAALARAAIVPMTAGGRPMFVPIVALVARYRASTATTGQTSQAFAVGIERVDSPKLAPLWLDQPARMHNEVAARPHAAVLES